MAVRLSELSRMSDPERERTLDDLVRRAKGKPNGQLKMLDAEIRSFEIRYEMSSVEMRAKFGRGEVADTADIARWLILLRARDRARG
jgi:hypothetical protein